MWWPALPIWAAGWAAMLLLDGRVDLANLAMLLVLASASASLWLPPGLSMAAAALAVLAFNWLFVPPRGSFTVDLRQHAVLLAALLVVCWIVALLMARLRSAAARAGQQALRAEQLRALGEALRDSTEPLEQAPRLRDALAAWVEGPVSLLMLRDALPAQNDMQAASLLGDADEEQLCGLWHCLRQSSAMGPSSGRHEDLHAVYLPLRGRASSFGAALLLLPLQRDVVSHAQSLCDQLGLALDRAQALRAARQAHDQAQAQGVRNALLAAVSHDYRTPLATIMGAASSLRDQANQLTPQQRQRLAGSIVDEAESLHRMTDNTLQLARLDAPGVVLQLDWESAEEIVGTVLRRVRAADPQHRVRARLEPGLPLLRCDALLLAQMLHNLVDNALKYSAPDAPVEVLVRRAAQQLVLAVRDRGPGIAPALRERIFLVFVRGESAGRRGSGVGLAVCRAIARAHGGELRLRPRSHGGSSFECTLPLADPPPAP